MRINANDTQIIPIGGVSGSTASPFTRIVSAKPSHPRLDTLFLKRRMVVPRYMECIGIVCPLTFGITFLRYFVHTVSVSYFPKTDSNIVTPPKAEAIFQELLQAQRG